ncbi:MAG: outer membrane protein assembly factor BamA [Rhizobiaceae bacterium]|nr:MAG: outer membrane protein assembly factor BamA [Rhizobiaceae bacterium]
MKAASKFLSAASAFALSAGLVVPGTVVVQLAGVTAAEAAVVSRIEVRGNKRVDAATIRDYMGIKPGKSFSNSDINEAVKKLFATGLFSNVRIHQAGSALVVQVDEYSVVNQVIFQGNKKIKDNELQQYVSLKPRGTFSTEALNQSVETIKQAYAHIGREDAVVTPQVIDLGENRVNVAFKIEEGGRTKIVAIDFVGNHAFSARRLKDVISTHQSNFLSFLLRNDVYDPNRLSADEEKLRRFYYDHGYADFRVISSSANLDQSKNAYTITFTVDEGQKYRFGDIGVESNVEGIDSKSLQPLLDTRKGSTYSAKGVEDSIVAITNKVAGEGYAFAQVTPRGNRDFASRTISVVYSVNQGPRVYIQKILIRGNTRTRDYVIRREFDINEGDAYNQVLVQRAKKRLEDLDYFSSVNISTAPGSKPDQVILVVDVVEKSTGQFTIGAGYSTGQTATTGKGINLSGAIIEKNFLGRGQYIKLSAGVGLSGGHNYALSFTEPYFLGRRISAGFDLFQNEVDYTHYHSETTGGTVRFGLPITEQLSTQVAYNFTSEKYKLDNCAEAGASNPCGIAPAIIDAVNDSPWTKSSVSNTILYNTIDDLKNPHEGIYATFSQEYAGLGGDANFLKFSGRANYYTTVSDEMDIVALFAGGAGYMTGLGHDLRVFDLFQNDDRIIRGFEYNGIGPYDSVTHDHLGGTTYFDATAELQFPLPFIPSDIGLRGAVFADAATLYGNPVDDHGQMAGTSMAWRASLGASILWASPFGPLRVDFAVPVLKQKGDKVQNFNFGVSTRF